MPNKYPVTNSSSIKPGEMRCFDVNQQRIIVAHIEGEFFAFDEMCSHEDYPLLNGALRSDHVECPLHGSRFCLRTGKPMEEPATEAIKVYPVELQDDMIVIEIND